MFRKNLFSFILPNLTVSANISGKYMYRTDSNVPEKEMHDTWEMHEMHEMHDTQALRCRRCTRCTRCRIAGDAWDAGLQEMHEMQDCRRRRIAGDAWDAGLQEMQDCRRCTRRRIAWDAGLHEIHFQLSDVHKTHDNSPAQEIHEIKGWIYHPFLDSSRNGVPWESERDRIGIKKKNTYYTNSEKGVNLTKLKTPPEFSPFLSFLFNSIQVHILWHSFLVVFVIFLWAE